MMSEGREAYDEPVVRECGRRVFEPETGGERLEALQLVVAGPCNYRSRVGKLGTGSDGYVFEIDVSSPSAPVCNGSGRGTRRAGCPLRGGRRGTGRSES